MKGKLLRDSDPMPFGKFFGKLMKEVPAWYLDWLMGQKWIKEWPQVEKYIEDNEGIIEKQLVENGAL